MLVPGQRVHFIGIGGVGISAIARVMLLQGYTVSGSDQQANALTEALAKEGATIHQGHDPANVGDAELVIISSAIPPDNVEVVAARRARIPVYKRADILGQLMMGYTGVAVAGTHGKTTTTAMIVHMLIETGRDPTYIVGGVVPSTGSNAGVGRGEAFVIEADEYDNMFLGLRPQVAVITNVEHDHPDLFPSMAAVVHAFNEFALRLPSEGLLVTCADDPAAFTLGNNRRVQNLPTISYGVHNAAADWQGRDWQPNHLGGMNFTLWYEAGRVELGRVMLRAPGLHNVQNALAALIVMDRLGVPLGPALAALATFTGAQRRFDVRGRAGGVTVIDDYAHHPTAIRATLAAARARFPRAGIWAVWQPHTYSRLRALWEGFAGAFPPENADHVLITDVYGARESAAAFAGEPGVADLVAEIDHPDVRHTPGLEDAVTALEAGVKAGDVVIILSAGDGPRIGEMLLTSLEKKK
jgi:UDP-N-acetylmuramate--alanine ligase